MDANQLFSLKGRTVMVTGASGGIGLHLAGVFARAGASVALTARRRDRIEAAAQALVDAGHRACAAYLDVTDGSSIGAAFDAVEKSLGTPVDTLLNNSGVLYAKRFLDQDIAEVGRLLDTNLKGAFQVAQEAARRMAQQGGGVIINVASTAGLAAGAQFSSYCASKAGLIQLTQGDGTRARAQEHPRQRHLSRQHRNRHVADLQGQGHGQGAAGAHSAAPAGNPGRPRWRRAPAGFRCQPLHDGNGDSCRWRPVAQLDVAAP